MIDMIPVEKPSKALLGRFANARIPRVGEALGNVVLLRRAPSQDVNHDLGMNPTRVWENTHRHLEVRLKPG